MDNIYIDTEKLFSSDEFISKFNSLYPDLNLNTLDNTIIIDIALEMYNKKIIDLPKITEEKESIFDEENDTKEIIQEYGIKKNYTKPNKIALNRIKADNMIPELFVPGEIIIINGLLNNYSVQILVDTGASSCNITKSCVKACELSDLVDSSNKSSIIGSNGINSSVGKIWYTELYIIDINEEPIKYPIVFDVIENISDDFDIILGSNFLRTFNGNINFNKRVISFDCYENNDLLIEINFM